MNYDADKIEQQFLRLGGSFPTSSREIQSKLGNIKAFLFDWDGVFNSGVKSNTGGSTFSEADAMGTNLLRFGHWMSNQSLPYVAILTGENNPTAIHLAKREHFSAVYYKTRNKAIALAHLQSEFNLKPDEIAFCFDDVLDLSVAKKCGLRFLVQRSGSPLFEEYVTQNRYCDYITSNSGSSHAIREVCELILGLNNQYTSVVDERCKFGSLYRDYLDLRNNETTHFYSEKSNQIIQTQPAEQ